MSKTKTRQAVGAVVFKDNKYLLVHKVKIVDGKNGMEDINGTWDFVKGGVQQKDMDFQTAVLRELKEETGSENYRIASLFDDKICFEFLSRGIYDGQETTMFYVEYIGNKLELNPQEDEIDQVKFCYKDEVIKLVGFHETLNFLNKVNW